MIRIISVIVFVPAVLFSTITNQGATLTTTEWSTVTFAGEFINNGVIYNSGELVFEDSFVNDSTMVCQETGIVTYAGGDQTVSAENYQELYLAGTGTKTLADSIFIGESLHVSTDTLDMNGYNIRFAGSAELSETEESVFTGNGELKITIDLDSPYESNIAGFGIGMYSFDDPGATQISRGHTAQTVYGNESINRYYNVIPQGNRLEAEIIYRYKNNELINADTEEYLSVFQSEDAGSTWTAHHGIADTTQNTITFEVEELFSLFTGASVMSIDFASSEDFGYLPFSVDFTDNSYAYTTPTSWEWDFDNDGITDSYEQHPTYIYEYEGIYSVELKVNTAGLIDSLLWEDMITIEYCPLSSPLNVLVDVTYPDAVISWTAVDTTICGNNIAPDGYIILNCEAPYEEDFWFTGYTTGTSFTHNNVAVFRPEMYYLVLTYKNYSREQSAYLKELTKAKHKVSWQEVKKKLISNKLSTQKAVLMK